MSLSNITKNSRPLKLILAMEAFSSLTNQFMQILLPWYMLSTTENILWTGFIGFCALLPNIFSSLFGATWIDKIGRSKAMLSCEVIQFLLLFSIPCLIVMGYGWPWLIGIIIFITSFFDAPGQLSRKALLPTFSRYAGTLISKTTGLVEAFDGMMTVFGPILAGLVIVYLGLLPAWVFCVLCCLCIINLCILLFARRGPRQPRKTPSYAETWNFVRKDKYLLYPLFFMLPTFIVGQSWELLLLPTYVYENGFNALWLGTLGAAFGIGTFLGGVLFAHKGTNFSFKQVLTLNYLGYALSIWVLYLHFPIIGLLIATILCGLPFGAFNAMMSGLILFRTPKEYRSKTLGIVSTLTYLIESISVLSMAIGIYYFGLQNILCYTTILFAILTFVGILLPRKNDFWQVISTQTK